MSQKILHIDPNSTHDQELGRLLESAGYIVAAADGLTALEIAQVEPPDLILLELDQPDLTGYETVTRLQAIPELRGVPVVALVSQPQPDSRPKALAAGCAGCLFQPLEPDQLLAQIGQHLAGWQETLTVAEEISFLRDYNRQLVERLEQQNREFTRATETLAHTDLMKSRFINLAQWRARRWFRPNIHRPDEIPFYQSGRARVAHAPHCPAWLFEFAHRPYQPGDGHRRWQYPADHRGP